MRIALTSGHKYIYIAAEYSTVLCRGGEKTEDARCEPVYGLDAAGFTACKESVHAHYVTSC
jgi:hypothetical protein